MHRVLVALFATAMLAACTQTSSQDEPLMTKPLVTVYKSATCQCCSRWLGHLQEQGFATKVELQKDLRPVRQQLGVPDNLASCHTAVIDGYVVEGHVPADDIRRLLRERPTAAGISAPGMPVGSPGMEVGERRDAYDVVLFDAAGNTQVFAHHEGRTP